MLGNNHRVCSDRPDVVGVVMALCVMRRLAQTGGCVCRYRVSDIYQKEEQGIVNQYGGARMINEMLTIAQCSVLPSKHDVCWHRQCWHFFDVGFK